MDALEIGVTLAGIAVAAIGNAIVTSRASGKTEGIIRTEIAGHKERIDKIEEEQDSQWSAINKHTADIGYLQGKTNGKARHAGDL